jgi:deoxyadenosine/deoxycytidine kinase
MSRQKPKVDEFLLHMRLIEKFMKKFSRIGVYGLPGEGKTTLIMALREKYQDTEWHFYEMGENPVEAPFIFAFISEEQPVPEFDTIFCMQYSTNYKESVTGVYFPADEWRPMADYVKVALRKRMGKLNITGKRVKNMNQLKKLLNGEVV